MAKNSEGGDKIYLRRSATEAQLGLEFESVSKMSLGLEFMVVSLSSDDASSGQI